MNQSTASSNGFMTFFYNLSLGKKLGFGFGAVLLIFVMLVVFIELKITTQESLQNRIVELRVPTNIAGHDLVNGINYSLAALRGYMILGKDSFKNQRQDAWKDIDLNLGIMTEMSKSWTVPKNIETLKELKLVMERFRVAQQKVEAVSHSADEQPAMKILLTEAAPRASKVIAAITGMINEEKTLPATPERKSLLALFADSRGSFALGLASIRGYLISGQQSWVDDFNNRWKVNSARLASIEKSRYLLNEAQLKHYQAYITYRSEFAPLPSQMFEVRGSKKWNMANYLLGTIAAPEAGKALKILRGMVANQNDLVAVDVDTLKTESTSIKIISIVATVIAVIVGILVSMGISRIIVGSVSEAMNASKRISEGDLSGDIVIKSQDETGVLLASLQEMQERLTQVIEGDIQTIVDTANNGDLSQRIELDSKTGFYKHLSSSINELVDVSERVVGDTVRVFGALAQGDLSQRIQSDYRGSFDQLKQDANATIEKIRQVIEGDIQTLVDSARKGDLNQRIDLSGKSGFFGSLSSGINELVDTVDNVFADVSATMSSMADGDLTNPIERSYQGSFDEVKRNINKTMQNLEQTVAQLRESGDLISTSSEEISSGNNNLSARTEQQASALEETASSMEELTSTVQNNSDNSQQANQLAAGARKTAQAGGEVVAQAATAMDAINESSRKISEIIGVIDEIAFQTNLLALNASVEAARAGEQGRGFAVVATEVRNLAGRSATAAKEIKELINDSVNKVDVGSDLVTQSGDNLTEIVESVKKVSDIISEIAAASQEQTAGIGQVNQAVSSMDEVTQQNAALAEETSAAAASMTEKAQEMKQLMGFFTVSTNTSGSTLSAAPAPAPAPATASVSSSKVGGSSSVKPGPVASTDRGDEWEEF